MSGLLRRSNLARTPRPPSRTGQWQTTNAAALSVLLGNDRTCACRASSIGGYALLALLDFPLAGVAFPLPFHDLLPILGISSVEFALPFQEQFPVHWISGVALPPPFPLPCQSPFPILRIGGGVSCALARAKFLRRLTLAWRRHVGRPLRLTRGPL